MLLIQDNTIRDGMQQKDISKDLSTKRNVISVISKTRIDSVEIGMCASEADIPILKEYASQLSNYQTAVVLTRMRKEDIDYTYQLFKKQPNVKLKLLVPVSDLHIEKKLETDKVIYLKRFERTLQYIKELGLPLDIVLEDCTRSDEKYLFQILEICSRYNPGFVTLADTVGCSIPEEYGALFKVVKEKDYSFELSAHCHNDLGLATANTLAAVMNGAMQVETTFLGIGERAGNTAVDEIVAAIISHKIVETSTSLKHIYKASNEIRDILKFELSPLKAILGDNVFAHESGIHQDGTIKDERMYQYLLPSDFSETLQETYSISGISSSKILKTYFSKYTDDEALLTKFIEFYRTTAKITSTITPEETVELYSILKGDYYENT
ncbi:LeuA family protein [Lactococcus garvieae]|uniref:LeuA family protein n=1 Tax=Lactococcus garvieae TaxID=1363 RepID=UPI00254A2C7C|nr:LeuA family protein [Lactococcus garvieae]